MNACDSSCIPNVQWLIEGRRLVKHSCNPGEKRGDADGSEELPGTECPGQGGEDCDMSQRDGRAAKWSSETGGRGSTFKAYDLACVPGIQWLVEGRCAFKGICGVRVEEGDESEELAGAEWRGGREESAAAGCSKRTILE